MNTVLRRMDTPENRAYWDNITRVAREVRADPRYHICCEPRHCAYGNGHESCRAIQKRNRQLLRPGGRPRQEP